MLEGFHEVASDPTSFLPAALLERGLSATSLPWRKLNLAACVFEHPDGRWHGIRAELVAETGRKQSGVAVGGDRSAHDRTAIPLM